MDAFGSGLKLQLTNRREGVSLTIAKIRFLQLDDAEDPLLEARRAKIIERGDMCIVLKRYQKRGDLGQQTGKHTMHLVNAQRRFQRRSNWTGATTLSSASGGTKNSSSVSLQGLSKVTIS